MKIACVFLQLAFLGNAVSEEQQQLNALDQMMNVKTIEEFMTFLRKDGRNVTEDDIYHRSSSGSGRKITRHGGYLAEPDVCSPREMTVELDVGDTSPDQVYFPRCTKVMRCGGCCSSSHVTCRPVEVDRSLVSVLKGQLQHPGDDYLIFIGFQKVLVERHLSCRMECGLSEKKCGVNKKFQPHQCACTCATPLKCLEPRAWDPETCRCACSRTRQCFNGQIFSQNSCQCEDDFGKQETSINGGSHSGDVDKYLSQRGQSANVAISGGLLGKTIIGKVRSDPAPPAPPAKGDDPVKEPEKDSFSERRKAAGEQDGVCSHLFCPPFFSAVMRSGLCVCTPRQPNLSRYRSRNARQFKFRRQRRRKYTRRLREY